MGLVKMGVKMAVKLQFDIKHTNLVVIYTRMSCVQNFSLYINLPYFSHVSKSTQFQTVCISQRYSLDRGIDYTSVHTDGRGTPSLSDAMGGGAIM